MIGVNLLNKVDDKNLKLSPPQYILREELYYTIGKSPCINVSELKEVTHGYEIIISVRCDSYDFCDLRYNAKCTNEYKRNGLNKQAMALRNIIPLEYSIGSIKISTKVYDICNNIIIPYEHKKYKNINELASNFCCALADNPYFKGVILMSNDHPNDLGNLSLIIDKKVIQFYADNISDVCGNYNEVAAKTFSNILQKNFPDNFQVTFSTYDYSCIRYINLFCK